MSESKRLSRVTNESEKMVGGVCAGLGKYFDIDPVLVRLGFVAAAIFGVSGGFWVYVILYVVMPPEETVAGV